MHDVTSVDQKASPDQPPTTKQRSGGGKCLPRLRSASHTLQEGDKVAWVGRKIRWIFSTGTNVTRSGDGVASSGL
eukprot:121710-Rhodomonas_salina.2